MENELFLIYDRIFKRIFALSTLAIINMINALFHTNYPPDSVITYPNKEFVSRFLKDRLADVILTIDGIHTYHFEAQIQNDKNIVLRILEMGFQYAIETREQNERLLFPEPIVIYLSKENNIPEESSLLLDFGKQGTFEYRVKNYVYLDHAVTELNQKKMVILIPFQLLRLKEIIHKNPTRENFLKLQVLLQHDIIENIDANVKVGNITLEDANQLLELTRQLYDHLFDHYYEIGGCEDMKPLLEGAMELPMDKYRIRIDELETELNKKTVEIEKQKAEAERQKAEAERQKVEVENQKAEMEELKKRILELEK